jgi:hypothetical protein
VCGAKEEVVVCGGGCVALEVWRVKSGEWKGRGGWMDGWTNEPIALDTPHHVSTIALRHCRLGHID